MIAELRRLGDALSPSDERVVVEPDQTYRTAGIFSFGKGLFERTPTLGADMSYKVLIPVHEGQLVFGRLNAWEGGIAIAEARHEGLMVSQEFPVCDIDRTVADPAFLAHICRWPRFWEDLWSKSRGLGSRTGVRRVRVHVEQLAEIEVPLPPLAEQCAIASRLDQIRDRCGKVLSLAHRSELVLEALIPSVASRHDLSEEDKQAAGWRRVPLAEVISPSSDFVAVEGTGSYPNFGILSFGRGTFPKVPIEGASTSAAALNRVRAGQFIYSRLFAFEGAYAYVPDEFDGWYISAEFPTFDVRPDQVDAQWLAAYLRAPDAWLDLASTSKGLGLRRQRVHTDAVLALEVWLPPIADQMIMLEVARRAVDAQSRLRALQAAGPALPISALNHALSSPGDEQLSHPSSHTTT